MKKINVCSVEKRNGDFVEFDENKIRQAVEKAFKNNLVYIKEDNDDNVFNLDKVLDNIMDIIACNINNLNISIIHIEVIQDIVVQSIRKAGFNTIASLYNSYRNVRQKKRDAYKDRVIKKIDSYLDKSQWKIKENSNMQYSVQGMNLFLSSDATKEYWLNKIYNKRIRNAHFSGSLHIHDLYLLSAYCIGWDLKDLLEVGFTGVKGKIISGPAKHFQSALGQICNFLFTVQGEAAGAEAFSNFDTLLAPFIYYDKLSYHEVKKCMKAFLYNMNVSTRVGFQCPFTNITMDLICPNFMKDEPVIVSGKRQDKTYSEFQTEMNMLNKAFAELMIEGDYAGQIFSFPIPTYCIDKDFDWDNPEYEKIWEMTSKYGIPYFANYINSDLNKEDARSMCPLHKDTTIDVIIEKNNYIEKKTIFIKDLYTTFINNYEQKIYVRIPKYNRKESIEKNTSTYEDVYSLITGVIAKHADKVIKIHLSDGEVICGDKEHLQYAMLGTDKPKSIPLKDITLDHRFLVHKDGTSKWKKIKLINKNIKYDDNVYCLEVDNKSHLFCLSNGIVTHNCRLKLDLTNLHKRGGGLFGANALTGSLGVVTINMPRIGHTSINETDFFNKLEEQLDIAKESLLLKRDILEKLTDQGLFPYTKFYLRSIKERTGNYWENHFLTIGLIGMHECCLNFLNEGIDTEKGYNLAIKVLKFMNDKLVEYQKKYGKLFNLEASPAEGVSFSICNKDKQLYPDMNCFKKEDKKYYTNSTNLPVDFTNNIFKALDHQNEIQSNYTGGTVFHTFLGEQIRDPQVTKELIKGILSNYKIPYISITPTFSICEDHGYINGEHFKCPKCKKDTLVYSRVVGYYRPVNNWNIGKEDEFKRRQTYEKIKK